MPGRLRHRLQWKDTKDDVRRDTHMHVGNCAELLADPSVKLNVGKALDASFT